MKGLIGKKLGMTTIFDAQGKQIPCTAIEAGPCFVTQVKTDDSDGYYAVQLAYGDKKEKNTPKPMKGHFAKANVKPKYKVVEFRDFDLDVSLGDELGVSIFEEGEKVSVAGTSKGKGFQGVVKRHGFRGVGGQTHGQHNRGRSPGSLGAASYPARVFKGMKMAGRTGGTRVKTHHLAVVKVLEDKNIILIKGAIPGPKGGFVIIERK